MSEHVMTARKAACAAHSANKAWDDYSPEEKVGAVFEPHVMQGIFNRGGGGTPLIDPNKPHPAIDAFKNLLTQMITTLGPTIISKLGPLITAWFNTIGGGATV